MGKKGTEMKAILALALLVLTGCLTEPEPNVIVTDCRDVAFTQEQGRHWDTTVTMEQVCRWEEK